MIVGLRDVDEMEKPHVRDSGVRAFTMRDIDERGLRAVMEEAIRIATDGTAGLPPLARHGFRAIRWTRPESARRSAAAPPTAKRIWQWK